MTIPRNLSFLAQGASSTGVLGTAYGGTNTNIAINDITINGVSVGKGAGAITGNIVLGNSALTSNTSGVGNVAVGQQALASISTANFNSAFGLQTLLNSTSANNSAFGTYAGLGTTSGGFNAFFGSRAGQTNITGQQNTYLGEASGYFMTGSSNTILGRFSGNDGTVNVTSSSNIIALSDGAGFARMYFDGTSWLSPTGGLSIGNTTDPGAGNLSVTGNIGSGVALSTWSAGKVAQIGNSGGTASVWADGSGDSYLINNAYYNAGWKYQVTGYNANYYILQNNGDHAWFSAPSGTAGNAITFTQAMTLNNSGNLLVGGTTNPSIGGAGQMIHALSSGINGIGVTQSTSGGICFVTNAANNGGTYYHMYFTDAGTSHGSITSNGTLTTYSTTSDARLKENIVDAPSGNIDAIKVRSFDWKSNGSHQTYGTVAQELIEAAPYAVTIGIDEEKIMQVDYSTLVPMMIKEIQDLKARITTLEAR